MYSVSGVYMCMSASERETLAVCEREADTRADRQEGERESKTDRQGSRMRETQGVREKQIHGQKQESERESKTNRQGNTRERSSA